MEAHGGGIDLSEELKEKLRVALQEKTGATLSKEQVIEIVKLFEFVEDDDSKEIYGL